MLHRPSLSRFELFGMYPVCNRYTFDDRYSFGIGGIHLLTPLRGCLSRRPCSITMSATQSQTVLTDFSIPMIGDSHEMHGKRPLKLSLHRRPVWRGAGTEERNAIPSPILPRRDMYTTPTHALG